MSDLKLFFDVIKGLRITSYMNVVSITLMCYDYLEYLDKEIEIIWTKKLTVTKIMYILTRYSAFVEAGVVIYQISIPGDWYKMCAFSFKFNAWLFVFGLGMGEVIMTIRTWAVWKKNRFLMYSLPVFYVAVWGTGFGIMAIYLTTMRFDPTPLNPYAGCVATYASSIVSVSWSLLLFYDFVMFVLILIPAYKAYRLGGMSRLMILVFRDGIVYYLYLFVLSLLNIICTLTFPPQLGLVFSLISRALHAILACRTVLNIHELGRPVLDESQQRLPNTLPRRPTQSQGPDRTYVNSQSQVQSKTVGGGTGVYHIHKLSE